jgi:hypothetical protein
VGMSCGALCVTLRAVTWLVHLQRLHPPSRALLAAAVLALSFRCVSALSYGERAGQARLFPEPSACTACPSAGHSPSLPRPPLAPLAWQSRPDFAA